MALDVKRVGELLDSFLQELLCKNILPLPCSQIMLPYGEAGSSKSLLALLMHSSFKHI